MKTTEWNELFPYPALAGPPAILFASAMTLFWNLVGLGFEGLPGAVCFDVARQLIP